MKPIISIIVPVYNVEKYLDRCVNSLVNQTYQNIEIILVDDGSPDRCPEMCDKYAKQDPRIKVIHKLNGGLSDARNVGLKQASGEYVLFVDSDDYIDLNTCEQFVEIIGDNKPDIIVGNAKRIEKNKVKIMKHTLNTYGNMITGTEFLKKELRQGTMYMASWLNLYNREFLINNNLFFKVGLLHEDELFTPIVFLKAKTVIATDIIFYNYIIREGSITTNHNNKINNAQSMIEICKELENIYSKIEDEELRKLLNNDLVSKFLHTFQVTVINGYDQFNLFEKKFLKGKAYSRKNKLKVILFVISKRLYYYVNKCEKLLTIR